MQNLITKVSILSDYERILLCRERCFCLIFYESFYGFSVNQLENNNTLMASVAARMIYLN